MAEIENVYTFDDTNYAAVTLRLTQEELDRLDNGGRLTIYVEPPPVLSAPKSRFPRSGRGLSKAMKAVLLNAVPGEIIMPPGPSRSALMKRGLIYDFTEPYDVRCRLTESGIQVRNRLLAKEVNVEARSARTVTDDGATGDEGEGSVRDHVDQHVGT